MVGTLDPFATLGLRHTAIRETIAAWEAFRRMGFDPAYLFFSPQLLPRDRFEQAAQIYGMGLGANQEHYVLGIELRDQGKSFMCTTGIMTGSLSFICDVWRKTAAAVVSQELDDATLDALWIESRACKELTMLVAAVLGKGFVLPRKLPSSPKALS